MKQNLVPWGVFAAFVACAIGFGWHAAMFRFDGPMGAAKLVVWLAFLLFYRILDLLQRQGKHFQNHQNDVPASLGT